MATTTRCYTSIPVKTGDTVTFDFVGTCGGGTPRVYLQFDGGASAGENTYDSGTCTQLTSSAGTVTYTIKQDRDRHGVRRRSTTATTARRRTPTSSSAGTRINF